MATQDTSHDDERACAWLYSLLSVLGLIVVVTLTYSAFAQSRRDSAAPTQAMSETDARDNPYSSRNDTGTTARRTTDTAGRIKAGPAAPAAGGASVNSRSAFEGAASGTVAPTTTRGSTSTGEISGGAHNLDDEPVPGK